MRVALFITCLTDTFFPNVGRAMVRVLRYHGCQVVFPVAQTCCGQPACNTGFRDEARALARRWVRIFEPYEWIVTPSASCAHMVKHQFPELLQADPDAGPKARVLAERTHELQSFLLDVLRTDPKDLPIHAEGSLTYLYSCHSRGQMTMEQAVGNIKGWVGPRYRSCDRLDQCCGFGGVFAANHPRVSEAMGVDKLDCLAQSGAEVVLCSEAGCTLHLQGLAHRIERSVCFKHLAELLSEAVDRREAHP